MKKITPNDNYNLIDSYDFNDLILREIRFENEYCVFSEMKEEHRICNKYDSRFINCIIYPLTFSVLPDGELLVNLLHCNGVSLGKGELVNEEFVNKVILDINRLDASYLQNHLKFQQDHFEKLMPFFGENDITEYETKRYFMNKIAEWIIRDYSKGISFDIRIRALQWLLSEVINKQIQQLVKKLNMYPCIITLYDMEKIVLNVEKELEDNFLDICEKMEVQKHEFTQNERSEGEIKFLTENGYKTFKLDDKLDYNTPSRKKIKIAVKDVLIEKPFSKDATNLLNEYLLELLSRAGRGGFMANIPLDIIMEALFRYSRDIMTYAQVYSKQENIIKKEQVNDAIVFLDSRVRLGTILGEFINEDSQ